MTARRTTIGRRVYPSARQEPPERAATRDPCPPPGSGLTVEETGLGAQYVRLRTDALGVLLDPDAAERLGIDLQIRASYLRGYRPVVREEAVEHD